jgi:hypothetical protein
MMWLLPELAMCTNSKDMLGYMGSCRFLCNTHVPACRLKINFTSNLKLIISFSILHIVLLSLFKWLSLVTSTRHTPLSLRVYLRLASRPSAGTDSGVTRGNTTNSQCNETTRRWRSERTMSGQECSVIRGQDGGAMRGNATTSWCNEMMRGRCSERTMRG